MKKYYYILINILIFIIIFVYINNTQTVNLDKMVKLEKFYTSTINLQKRAIKVQKEVIRLLNVKLGRKQTVTVSFYHPASRGINSDSDHTNTAIMVTPIVGRTVAISDELFNLGWLGAKIYINGYGIFVAEDRMDETVKGKCLDICVNSEEEAFRRGRKYNIIAMRL